MSSSKQIRWMGLAAVVAGAMFLFSDLLDLATSFDGFGSKNLGAASSPILYTLQSGLALLAGLLLLVGLAGLYVRQLD